MVAAKASGDDGQCTLFAIAAKVARRDENWSTEEVEGAGFWLKVFLAAVVGTVWGLVPFEGFYALLGATCAIALLQLSFNRVYLGIDEDDHGGKLALLQEGAGPAFALFMLAWICAYSQANQA